MSALRVPRRLLLAVLIGAIALLAAGTASADASSGGWWILNNGAAPTNLAPGGKGIILASAVNAGYEAIPGTTGEPIVLTDVLPAGLEVTEVEAEAGPSEVSTKPHRELHKLTCTTTGVVTTGQTLSCPWAGSVPALESIRMFVRVKVVGLSAGTTVQNRVEVSGSVKAGPSVRSFNVTNAPTPFGVERYEILPETASGALDTQAGAHPFQLSSIFDLNQTEVAIPTFGNPGKFLPNVPAQPKNLHFVLPPGLIGKAAKVPVCTGPDFATTTSTNSNLCPENTAIGYAVASVVVPYTVGYIQVTVPVFNLEPQEGEPARFGFEALKTPVVLDTKVRSGKDYGVEVSVNEATQSAAVLSTQLTLWGTPADPRHDNMRGWECLEEGKWVAALKPCKTEAQIEKEENEQLAKEGKPAKGEPEAFLTMPTSCTETPVTSTTGIAWTGQTYPQVGEESSTFTFPAFTGCEKLPFEPTINVQPDKAQAATPSGYTVTVEVPQKTTLEGVSQAKEEKHEEPLGESDPKVTELTLPPGVFASAGASQGLGTCSTKGFGFEGVESEIGKLTENNAFNTAELNTEVEECPETSKIGTVDIETPLLEEHVIGGIETAPGEVFKGGVFLGRVDTKPFGSPLVLFILAESPTSHVQVKLAGEVTFEPNGQIKSVFKNTPPVPFSKLTLHLNDGPRAAQATPEKCGDKRIGRELRRLLGRETHRDEQLLDHDRPRRGCLQPRLRAGLRSGRRKRPGWRLQPLQSGDPQARRREPAAHDRGDRASGCRRDARERHALPHRDRGSGRT